MMNNNYWDVFYPVSSEDVTNLKLIADLLKELTEIECKIDKMNLKESSEVRNNSLSLITQLENMIKIKYGISIKILSRYSYQSIDNCTLSLAVRFDEILMKRISRYHIGYKSVPYAFVISDFSTIIDNWHNFIGTHQH